MDFERQIDDVARTLTAAERTGRLRDRVSARLEQRPSAPGRPWAIALASLVLVVGVGMWQLTTMRRATVTSVVPSNTAATDLDESSPVSWRVPAHVPERRRAFQRTVSLAEGHSADRLALEPLKALVPIALGSQPTISLVPLLDIAPVDIEAIRVEPLPEIAPVSGGD
jgi:hypothetical protein